MSLASALDKIETDVLNFVHAEEAKLGAAIQKGEAQAAAWWTTFEPVAEADVAAAWTKYQPQIMGAIAAVEQIGLTLILPGSGVTFDKLGAAVTAVAAMLGTQGVTLAKGVLTTVIQQAVTALGNANPAPAP